MPKAVYEVRGGRQLRKSLRTAGDDLADLKDVHKQAAAIAADRAADRAPRRSGRLAATIRAAGTKTAGIVRVGNNTRVPYAPVIHWGWKRRHITANPFASRGAQESEPRWLPLYERYVDTTLDKIKGA
ncbi:HK97 gp10 family phage protein [uncultured Leifsonia sp.]|uniref:HK97 gp10 family phage protein n=1 Tax=uncultured Leifsonia sp. TaxID=340359 RepID=UPI0028D092BE|nr:HK97 gp10 family phage protein [uncultured Leifsonia sp.]